MKDSLFRSNTKLFDEVDDVKRSIRNDIREQARNCKSKSDVSEKVAAGSRSGDHTNQ